MSEIGNYLQGMFSLEGKVALVVGSGGDIGGSVAACYNAAGATVLLCDNNRVGLSKVQSYLKYPVNSRCYELDLLKEESFDNFVDDVLKENGKIDILVNCAGINKREGILDVTDETFEWIFGVQFVGVYKLSASIVRKSMRKTGGKIINVGSYTCYLAMGGSSVYGAAKNAIVSLTKSMSIEWARYNIQANCVCPGHFRTGMTEPLWENKDRAQWVLERIACERPGRPDELNGAFLLLASPASDYISGAMLNVDGGSVAGGRPYPFDTEY